MVVLVAWDHSRGGGVELVRVLVAGDGSDGGGGEHLWAEWTGRCSRVLRAGRAKHPGAGRLGAGLGAAREPGRAGAGRLGAGAGDQSDITTHYMQARETGTKINNCRTAGCEVEIDLAA